LTVPDVDTGLQDLVSLPSSIMAKLDMVCSLVVRSSTSNLKTVRAKIALTGNAGLMPLVNAE
jgi:hypothetical protein